MSDYFSNVEERLASDFSSSPLNYNVYMHYLGEPLQEFFNFEPVSESTVYEIILLIKKTLHMGMIKFRSEYTKNTLGSLDV